MLACTKSIRIALQVCKGELKPNDNSFQWYSKRVSDGVAIEGECSHLGQKMRAEEILSSTSFSSATHSTLNTMENCTWHTLS